MVSSFPAPFTRRFFLPQDPIKEGFIGLRSVPKDLTRVKSKVIFNLTRRQIVCFGGGALIGVPLFFWLRPGLGASPAAICMMLTMLPFFLLGLYENNGRPLEKVLRDVADTLVRRPKARPYRTNNVYGALMRQEAIDKEVRKLGARKLTREEKEQIKAVIRKNRPNGRQPGSAQETIPYDRIWPDGICLARGWYTKTLQFQDINYQLSHNDAKSAIFEGWCDFLNYFDSSIHLQFSFLNRNADADRFENCIHIPVRRDGAERIRSEYAQILSNQLARGSNGIERVKYLTFGIRADSLKTARARLDRIELDVLANLKRMGVAASLLDGRERLHLLHRIFHTDTQEPFRFEWEWLAPSGLSTKDFVAPSSFAFGESRRFRMGGTLGAVSVLQILAPELNDRMLADFLDIDASLIVTMHIQSIDQNAAIKQIKRKITDLDKTKMEEQKRAVRAGYDMDILPSDLATYGAEAKKLLEDLQSRNERMFLVTFLVLNTGTNRQALENIVFQAQGVAQKYNCQLTRLDFQQEKALAASLPLGVNELEIQRALTTSSTAIFVPFTTQELFQTTGEPMYYGLNALSNNMIMADRKQLKNPNGLILGTPGSGKSFSAKREITNCYLLTDDDILICDPEAEYAPLVEALHGQVIRISPSRPPPHQSHGHQPQLLRRCQPDLAQIGFHSRPVRADRGRAKRPDAHRKDRDRPRRAHGVPPVSGGPTPRKHARAGRSVQRPSQPAGKPRRKTSPRRWKSTCPAPSASLTARPTWTSPTALSAMTSRRWASSSSSWACISSRIRSGAA